jgi:YebC/PmpR family DNA-binding regulatory protein
MAGHSHWANIAHKKGRMDKKKGAVFTKLSKAIIAACKRGGGDPDSNLALRYALDKARKSSMPRDNIERAIKKGLGESGDVIFENLLYEGYGSGGVAVLCDILTENRNRTAPEVRKIFEYHGGNLGTSGSVAWMFERKGLFLIPANTTTEEQLFEIALEAGAEDVSLQGDSFQVLSPVDQFDAVNTALEQAGLTSTMAEVSRIAQNTVDLNLENGKDVLELLEELEEHEDVQGVTANFNIPDELMAQLTGEEE